ncbi:MAG: arginine--tRNA ligase [Planctomycetota bacterium]|nr:arginine--tRNA ligase [Planctomycetota bacterium]
MQDFVDRIRAAVSVATGLDAGEVKIEQPRDPELGDFAFPCFPLAKTRKAPPPKIAAELAAKIVPILADHGIAVEATGPYLNFRVDRPVLARVVVSRITEKDERYGGSDEGAGRTIVIDLSSPNIAKPMHVGHLRSTIIGAAIQRLHDALGYRTVGINHVGDWGSQFGKLVAAIDRWGGEVDLEGDPIRALLSLYVRFHDEAEKDPALEEAARAAFRELESGREGHVREAWSRLTELSMREFDKIYQRLGVEFDLVRGESWYEPYLDQTVERIEAAGVTEMSEGALIVGLGSIDKDMPPCLLRKSDGTTLYATRDLAALFTRWEEFGFDRCLYVVGSDQRLHFRQLKAVLRRLDLEWESRVEHVDFGMLRLPEGKLSTRKGQVIFLEDLLDRATLEARRIIAEKNPSLSAADEVAEQVGVGAVVFHDLKKERVKDVVFEWDQVLSFEGETGPYVQYTHARLASILRKAPPAAVGALNVKGVKSGAEGDWTALEAADQVLLALGRFPAVVRSAAEHAEPSEVSQYLLSLCRETNSWYSAHRVLGQEPGVTAARLGLVSAAKIVIRNGLRLLGVVAPEEM